MYIKYTYMSRERIIVKGDSSKYNVAMPFAVDKNYGGI
jgi:hypothetical protein